MRNATTNALISQTFVAEEVDTVGNGMNSFLVGNNETYSEATTTYIQNLMAVWTGTVPQDLFAPWAASPPCSATAATPAYADVLAALPLSGNTCSTFTVTIPAASATWTSNLNYAVPSGVGTLIVQGSGTPLSGPLAWGAGTITTSITHNAGFSSPLMTSPPPRGKRSSCKTSP